MIRRLWWLHRRALVALLAAAGVCAALAWIVATTLPGQQPTITHPAGTAPRRAGALPPRHRAAITSNRQGQYRPGYVSVPATPTQEQFDHELAAAESPASIAATEALTLPPGRCSQPFPCLPAAERSGALTFADGFSRELLDVNFRADRRRNLLAWAVEESAANTMPGVPAAVGSKALYASLDSDTSPVASSAAWVRDARVGVVERASDVVAGVDPAWSRLVARGWMPRDPLLAFLDVSGRLTLSSAASSSGATGGRETVEYFSFVLTVGSALHHPGYGAVGVSSWRVTG